MNESMRKIVYYENILEFKENTKSELHLTEVKNWQLCRTCLVESREDAWDVRKMCVMDVLEGKFLNPHDMMEKLRNLELPLDEAMPQKICKDCLEKLTSLYFFSIQMEKAEQVLKSLSLKLNSAKTKEEDKPPQNITSIGNENKTENLKDNKNEEHHKDFVTFEEIVESCKSPLQNTSEESENVDVGSSTDAPNTEKYASPKGVRLRVNKLRAKSPSVIKGNESNADVVVENKSEFQEAVLTKQEVSNCDSTADTEHLMDSQQDIMDIDEGYEVIIEDDDYGFEGDNVIEDAAYDSCDVVATTVEIYLNDGTEDELEEKYNIAKIDQTVKHEDVEVVVPNETGNEISAEPIYISRLKRTRKTTYKAQFKHRQQRVTKPLLQNRKCSVCKETFNLQRDLVAHVKEHHPNSKAYKCRECGQLFSYTQSLSRHMNTHKEELHKNQCTFCPKAFMRPDDLTRHIRTHTGERPYKCPQCNKAFKQQGEMKQHLNTHMETRSYECDLCYCVLTSRNSLYLHKKANHRKTKEQQLINSRRKLSTNPDECNADDNVEEEE